MNKVVDLNTVRPKEMNRRYKGHSIKLIFQVADRRWKWEVTMTHTTIYSEIEDTTAKALRAAERHIDNQLKLRGENYG